MWKTSPISRALLKSLKRLRWAQLAFIHLLLAVFGATTIIEDAAGQASPAGWLAGTAIAFVVVLCCLNDSRIVGKPLLHIAQLVMLWTWPVTAPVYLVWARGLKGFLWCLLLATTILLATYAGMLVALQMGGPLGTR
jgi:hypothetical protein